MNTYYYLDGLEIKTIETVKSLDFIQKKKHSSAVATIAEIIIPVGYERNGMVLELTALADLQGQLNAKAVELTATDSEIPVLLESVLIELDDNNTLKKEDLSQASKDLLDARVLLRAEIEAIQALIDAL